jgi:hypothetical protein
MNIIQQLRPTIWTQQQEFIFAVKFELFKRSNNLGILSVKEFLTVCGIVAEAAKLPTRKFLNANMLYLLNKFNVNVDIVNHDRWQREKLWTAVTVDPIDMKVLSRGIPGLSSNASQF